MRQCDFIIFNGSPLLIPRSLQDPTGAGFPGKRESSRLRTQHRGAEPRSARVPAGRLLPAPVLLTSFGCSVLGWMGDCVRPPKPSGTLLQLESLVRCLRTTALTRTEIPKVEASWPLSIDKSDSGPPLLNPNFQN